jgi:hypothetical protein
MTNAHNDVVSALSEVLNPIRGEIRLLGRVDDPLVGNPSDKEVFFLIPDLHVLSTARQERFGKYGFNYSDSGLLVKLLQRMAALRKSWDLSGDRKLVTVQIGDFFDMWREFSGVAKPAEVSDDAHGDLRDVLYRGIDRGKPCLKATMILGNHDTRNGIPLPEIPFKLKAFNRTDDDKPFLFFTHGDAFDILETTLPEPIKEFAVYFVGSLTPKNKYWVGNWGKYAGKINKPLKDMESAITEPEHAVGTGAGSPQVIPGQDLPSIFCQEIDSPDKAEHIFFKQIYESIDVAEENNLPGQHVRIAAIGHTHKAFMTLYRPGNGKRPLILMDVGAWIEQCSYPLAEGGGPVSEPSAQLGVIHDNDARLYQIRILSKV